MSAGSGGGSARHDICARLCWLVRLASNYRRTCAAGPRRTLGQHGLALWEIGRWVQVAVGRQGTGSTLARHRGIIPMLQSMFDAVRDGVGRSGPRPASQTDARRVLSWAVAEAFLTSSPEGEGLSRTPHPARPPPRRPRPDVACGTCRGRCHLPVRDHTPRRSSGLMIPLGVLDSTAVYDYDLARSLRYAPSTRRIQTSHSRLSPPNKWVFAFSSKPEPGRESQKSCR